MKNLKARKYKVSDILKTKKIFRFSYDQTVAQVLPQLTSTHDAAFVFDNKDKFMGIVSPHFLFKSRSFNKNSKLKNIVKMPPKLRLTMNLANVANAMLESRVYFLPVVNGEFKGIVTINRLLSFVIKNEILNHGGGLIVSDRELVTIDENSTVSQVLNVMDEKKVDKIPVVNKEENLVGFVSKYDLKDLVRDSDNYERRTIRSSRKESEFDDPIKKYMKRRVFTQNKMPNFTNAYNIMKQNKVGSILIVDNNNRLVSIVTKRDLLTTISASLK